AGDRQRPLEGLLERRTRPATTRSSSSYATRATARAAGEAQQQPRHGKNDTRQTRKGGNETRKVVAAEYLSLDGVTEDPGPSGEFRYRGWTIPYWNDELAEHQSAVLFASEALLLGRVTYEEFVASWPLRSGDPFTDKMNSMPKFVASTTLAEPLDWNAA